MNPEIRARNDRVYQELDFLVDYALSEQRRINQLPVDDAEKHEAFEELRIDLDRTFFYNQHPVTLTGNKVFHLPVVGETDESSGVPTAAIHFRHELAPDEEIGVSFGFSVKDLPLYIPGIDSEDPIEIGTRFVICHALFTGEETNDLGADGNFHTARALAHFAVESSQLRFQGDFYSVDLRPLRASTDEFYADVDTVLYGPGRLPRRLQAIQALMDEHGFEQLPANQQQQFVNYLNNCEGFRGAHVVWAHYMLDIEEGVPLLTQHNPIAAELGHFTLCNQFEIRERRGTPVAIQTGIGTGLGIQGRLLEADYKANIIVPLHQRVGFVEYSS